MGQIEPSRFIEFIQSNFIVKMKLWMFSAISFIPPHFMTFAESTTKHHQENRRLWLYANFFMRGLRNMV